MANKSEQNGAVGAVPKYRICCLVPQQVDENSFINFSSFSELNRFLILHGIADKFDVDSGRCSASTCTEDLSTICSPKKSEVNGQVLANKEDINQSKREQIWKHFNKLKCYNNEVVSWFGKRSDSNKIFKMDYISKENLINNKTKDDNIGNKELSGLKRECSNVECLKEKGNEINKNSSFKSIFIKTSFSLFKKQKKQLVSQNHIHNINVQDEIHIKPLNISIKTPFTTESVVSKTKSFTSSNSTDYEEEVEACIEETVADNFATVSDFKVDSCIRESRDELIPSTYEVAHTSHIMSTNAEIKRELQLIESSDTSSDWFESISVQSKVNCQCDAEENMESDETFYDSPAKFINDIANTIMKKFGDEECDTKWLLVYENENIQKKYLGINKEFSALYIMKKMLNNKTSNCLFLNLTARQKRLLAEIIVESLKEFNISGSRWGLMVHEILKKICYVEKEFTFIKRQTS